MKVLILAAGYGTRLEQDLKSDAGTAYKHLIGIPKPLLPLGDKVLLDYWMELITASANEQLNGIIIATNATNHGLFEAWTQAWPHVQLFCDGSTCNEERSGAVGCMKLVVDHFNIEDDLLVIAGDTVFKQGFQLQPLLDRFSEINRLNGSADLLVYVTCKDEDVNKHGILETDDSSRVITFLEKPSPEETTSRKECPCLYMLSKESVKLLDEFLLSKQNAPLAERDAPGNFIRFLITRRPVFAMEVAGRFDVGNLRSYLACNDYFTQSSHVQS